ncbi:coronin-7-like isoform X1 [Labeo rohita]|uniref:Coronin-7-like isoform X1 n=1 Tax=Labeo rohita TaxID=84645 RepID=A0A498N3N7_LABRO|nr:coronin-7-like isoform X1 [Labeo rohita]
MFISTPKLLPLLSLINLCDQCSSFTNRDISQCSCPTLSVCFSRCVQGHQGNRDSRVLWVKDDNLLTTGFNQMRQQEVRLWDSRKLSSSLSSLSLATSNADFSPYITLFLCTSRRRNHSVLKPTRPKLPLNLSAMENLRA